MKPSPEAPAPRVVVIAVASQNWRTVTPHPGRTRRFLLFTAAPDGTVVEAGRFELPKVMVLHGWPPDRCHPLSACDVVVAATAGDGFRRRLGEAGVRVVVTEEEEPRAAAAAALSGCAPAG